MNNQPATSVRSPFYAVFRSIHILDSSLINAYFPKKSTALTEFSPERKRTPYMTNGCESETTSLNSPPSPHQQLATMPADKRGRLFGAGSSFQTKYVVPFMYKVFAHVPPRLLYNQIYYRLSKGARNLYAPTYQHRIFSTVNLETRTICNGKCLFCPASIKGVRPDELMPWEIFVNVIDQLKKISFSGQIALFINNEPLLDSRLPQMVSYVRAACPAATVVVSTNGILLNLERALELYRAGLDRLIVNMYTRNRSWLPQVHQIALELPDEYWRKTYVFFRRDDDELTNRAGASPNKPKLTQPIRAFCELPFNQINITASGRVGLCCLDYYFSEEMGNVAQQELLSIWFGARLQQVRQSLLNYDRQAANLCTVCDYPGYKQLVGPYSIFRRFVPWLWW